MDDAHTGVARRKRPEQELPSGVLTAGSFDDNIYPPYFRSFLNKAGQNPHVGNIVDKLLSRRVEVFVKNGHGAPVGNAHVHIKPMAGATMVELITRSDGRAVFLSSLDQFEANGGLTVEATADNGQPVSQSVEMDADRCTIILPDAAGTLPRNLDLTIVLDTTGSMKDEIAFLKAEIKAIASTVRERFPNVDMRLALICYRDEGMGDEYVTRKFEFTSRIDEFHKNLAAQNANGGGDIPEAMQRGLEDAVNLAWRDADTARVAFLIADAPPHRKDAEQTLAHLNALRKKGVAIYPVFASSDDPAASAAAEVVLRAAALITGGQYLFLTDDSGVGDAHAEPHIPYYHVEKLNQMMIRMIAGELSGKRTDPDPTNILRTVGTPPKRGRQD
jgi:von Willebrand factor type A domain